jgi:hypothetical protein
MNGQTLAHVRRILTGSDRALIHAVTDAGHEHKIEVPEDAVRDIEPDRGFVLMLSWSLLPLPRAAEPATNSTAADPPPGSAASTTTTTPTPANAVDAEFMALMARSRRATPTPTTPAPAAASGVDPEHQIAALLGLAPSRPT